MLNIVNPVKIDGCMNIFMNNDHHKHFAKFILLVFTSPDIALSANTIQLYLHHINFTSIHLNTSLREVSDYIDILQTTVTAVVYPSQD